MSLKMEDKKLEPVVMEELLKRQRKENDDPKAAPKAAPKEKGNKGRRKGENGITYFT